MIWHSDQGSQFVSLAFGQQARAAGIAQSMDSRGDCYDNSVAESFFATLKKELVDRRSWPQKAELRTEIFDYIEIFDNRRRRHSTLGMLSPVDYENSTRSDPGARLAASRLVASETMNTTATAQIMTPNQPLSTETGGRPSAGDGDICWSGALPLYSPEHSGRA